MRLKASGEMAVVVLITAVRTFAQDEMVIHSFQGNGVIAWSEGTNYPYHRVEWASSLTGTWQRAWSHLLDVTPSPTGNTANIPMFYRIVGYSNSLSSILSPVPATGVRTSYATGDDGDYEAGIPWPSPHFTVDATGSNVIDNLTGLMWTRDARACSASTQLWAQALASCENFNYGGYTNWRMPNIRELLSLTDWGRNSPALPSGHPFLNVGTSLEKYWSSTPLALMPTTYAYYLAGFNFLGFDNKTNGMHYVWPVRTHISP